MQLTFRIDAREGVTADKVKEFFEKYSDVFEKFLIYEEVADKTEKVHWQGIIYTESTVGSIREKVRRFFPDMQKGDYSLAKVKTENYEVYITKDKNRLCSKGYTDSEILALEEKSYKKEGGNTRGKKDSRSKYFEYMEFQFPDEKSLKLRTQKEQLKYIEQCVEYTADYFSTIVERGFGAELVKQHVNSWLYRTDQTHRESFISRTTDFIFHNLI